MAIWALPLRKSLVAPPKNRVLTDDPVRSGGKQHSSVTLEGFPCGALHLAIPEQAPSSQYSDTLLAGTRKTLSGVRAAFAVPVGGAPYTATGPDVAQRRMFLDP
jgi:hypothetical protein